MQLIKQEAYRLRKQGVSFGKIAIQLDISKTRAFGYVNEMMALESSQQAKKEPTQDGQNTIIEVNKKSKSNTAKNVPADEIRNEPIEVIVDDRLPIDVIAETPPNAVQNSVPLIPEHSEQNILNAPNDSESGVLEAQILPDPTAISLDVPIIKKVKEFTGDELVSKSFDSLQFTGKFQELIGKPSRVFSAIIWGLPKGGKSNLSVRFADYLHEYFGKSLYVASEEGESLTLQEKFRDIGGSGMTIIELRDKDKIRGYIKDSAFDFVFIDSINNAGIDADFLEILKEENSKKSFIGICQATKGGNFKGDQAITHNCDFVIKVVAGTAYQLGRFGPSAEMSVFEEPLYVKNTCRKADTPVDKATDDDVSEDLQGPNTVTQSEAIATTGVVPTQMQEEPSSESKLSTKRIFGPIEIIAAPIPNEEENSNSVAGPETRVDENGIRWIIGDAAQEIKKLDKKSVPFQWPEAAKRTSLLADLAYMRWDKQFPIQNITGKPALGAVSSPSPIFKSNKNRRQSMRKKVTPDSRNDVLITMGLIAGVWTIMNWAALTTKNKTLKGGSTQP